MKNALLGAFLIFFACALPVFGSSEVVFRTSDAILDDNGPGYYSYPVNSAFSNGMLDITTFEVIGNGKTVKFRIGFLNNSSRFKNVDIYIDKDHLPGSGEGSAISGRMAVIARESFWEQAVLLTPFPKIAREELDRISPDLSPKILVPANLETKGGWLACEISTAEIGDAKPWWGYIVIATLATSEAEDSKNRGIISIFDPSIVNAKVKEKPGSWNFGGGNITGISPNIIDLITASLESQARTLSGYNLVTARRAELKAVYASGFESPEQRNKKAQSQYTIEATILALGNKTLTIDKGARDGIAAGMIGVVVDEYGTQLTNVVVDKVFSTYSLCKVMKVSMVSYVTERMKVRF